MANDFTEQVLKLIKKDWGEGIAVSGDDFLRKPPRIIPFSPAANVALGGGIPEGSWVTLYGKEKLGKALELNSKLFTENGEITMKDVQVGMNILTPEGSAKVIGVYPQGKTSLYEVLFDDGSIIRTSPEHLWEVHRLTAGKIDGNVREMSTQEMLNEGVLTTKNNIRRYYIETSVAKFDNQEKLPINPYILGVLIGDGSLTNKGVRFTNTDEELVSNIKKRLKDGYEVISIHGYEKEKYISNRNNFSDNEISRAIYSLGLRVDSHNKFIPEIYKFSSYENRIELIKGLMDTDGEIGLKEHQPSYTTVSFKLANDFKFLIESIGGICIIKERYTSCNGKKFLSYRCSIRVNNSFELFGISRKISRCKVRTKNSLKRSIVSIKKVEDAETQCIEVDSARHLYLTNNFIATHNTTSALHFAAKCQKPKYGGKHIYYLNVEGRIKEMNLKGIYGLKTDPDNFTLISSDEDKILSAQDFLNIAEKILLTHKECVVIIDSYSMLCHEKEITDGVGTSTRGGGAALLAQFCRQMAGVVPVKRSIVVGISQLMANTSGYGAAIQEKGGNAIRYQVDVKMRCKSAEEWLEKDKRVGQKVTWLTECTALGAPPGTEFVSYLRYGYGLDEIAETIQLGTDFGLISKGGSYYYCDFMQTRLPALGVTEWNDEIRKQYCRGHGEAGIYELIKQHPDWIEYLEKDIATMLGVK